MTPAGSADELAARVQRTLEFVANVADRDSERLLATEGVAALAVLKARAASADTLRRALEEIVALRLDEELPLDAASAKARRNMRELARAALARAAVSAGSGTPGDADG